MALTRNQVNAMARHVAKTVQPKQQPQQTDKHAGLMEAFRRVDGLFPSKSEIKKASGTLSPMETPSPAEQIQEQSKGQLPDNEQ